MNDEVLGALGTLTLKCQDLERTNRELEVKVKKQRRALRRLSFSVQLEFVCILCLTLGMGILAKGG